MAEEKHAHKKKHKGPHKMITTRAKDGSFGHEHIEHPGGTPVFAGTSRDLADLHQHMDDHYGSAPGGGEEEEAEGAAPGGAGAGEPEAV